MTSRHYCITFYKKPVHPIDTIKYAIYGEEICPTTGTIHWQTYIELDKAVRFAAVKKMYNDDTIHCEKRKGTRDQARTYCMKDKKFV